MTGEIYKAVREFIPVARKPEPLRSQLSPVLVLLNSYKLATDHPDMSE